MRGAAGNQEKAQYDPCKTEGAPWFQSSHSPLATFTVFLIQANRRVRWILSFNISWKSFLKSRLVNTEVFKSLQSWLSIWKWSFLGFSWVWFYPHKTPNCHLVSSSNNFWHAYKSLYASQRKLQCTSWHRHRNYAGASKRLTRNFHTHPNWISASWQALKNATAYYCFMWSCLKRSIHPTVMVSECKRETWQENVGKTQEWIQMVGMSFNHNCFPL